MQVDSFIESHESEIRVLIEDFNSTIKFEEIKAINENFPDHCAKLAQEPVTPPTVTPAEAAISDGANLDQPPLDADPLKTCLNDSFQNKEPLPLQDKNADLQPDSNTYQVPELDANGTEGPVGNGEAKKNEDELGNFSAKGKLQFPNAKVGQEYKYSIKLTPGEASEIDDFSFEGLEQLGLSYDRENQIITGVPSKDGEFDIPICYKRKDWEPGRPIITSKSKLIINPDPRSLWKNLPSDKNGLYYKEDISKESKLTLDRNLVGVSVRGRSHAHEGKYRDDDFAFAYEDGWYIIAVADGAGYAKFSREGSRIACKSALEYITHVNPIVHDSEFNATIRQYAEDTTEANRKLVGDMLYNYLGFAAHSALKNIETVANDNKAEPKDYATTLLLAICKKMDFGSYFFGTFWVGDGAIGLYNKGGFLKIMGEPDGGEYAGQTRFLTMKEIMDPAELYRRLRFHLLEDFTALILMTDGISDPIFQTDSNLMNPTKWDEFWQDLSKEVEFSRKNKHAADKLEEWMGFWSPGNHDDRTIAILY